MSKIFPNLSPWRIPNWFPDLTSEQKSLLRKFLTELLKFNPRVNLVSPKSLLDADRIHFADSILAWRMVAAQLSFGATIYDFGSGNGFPGLVAASLSPDIKICFVEVDDRKCEFIKHVGSVLNLENIQVLNQRVETLEPRTIEFGISRGFASLDRSCEWTSAAFVTGGRYFHMKSLDWKEEASQMSGLRKNDWDVQLLGLYQLPESQISYCVAETTRR